MAGAAAFGAADERLRFSVGVAEALPFPNGTFQLVVSTTSFDHWSDQQRGLLECHRVLASGGHLLLVDQFSPWLAPTWLGRKGGLIGRRGLIGRGEQARTARRAGQLLAAAGFRSLAWHRLYAVIINGVTASA
jgi:SAM-dependent methyltransferase